MARQNPWSSRWRTFKDGHDPHEDALLEMEARDAERMPVYECEVEGCGGTTHYRPGVGGWWCDTCGELGVH
jgi:hypothetical protein